MEPVTSSSPGNVGAAIALKKSKKKRSSLLKEGASKSSSPSCSKQNASWQVLVESALLYGVCLLLPTVLGFLARRYKRWCCSHLRMQPFSLNSEASSLQLDKNDDSWNLYTSASYYLCEYWVASSQTSFCRSTNWMANGDEQQSDTVVVLGISLCLALMRIFLVRKLVPSWNTHPQALMRCKSIHLLSSAYPKSMTPRSSRVQLKLSPPASDHNLALPDINDGGGPPLPPLLAKNEQLLETQDSDEWVFRDVSSEENNPRQEEQVPMELPKEPTNDEDFTIETLIYQTDMKLPSHTHPQEKEEPHSKNTLPNQQQQEESQTVRVYSAPRYATAVFRILYCTMSIGIALKFFRDADFWPVQVGGHGSTQHCWDLSGGLSLAGMDGDFDHRNRVLRRYFLVQVSYHIHSGAFHILSMLLLANKRQPEPTSQSNLSVESSMTAYLGSAVQHVTAIGLMSIGYLFSSLRRLGAIGMFAFDVSSWSLHFLQICMNAPMDSILRRPNVVFWVHRGLVIPCFLYCRLYIWPFVVWYSATVESKNWLKQLENTLVPGSAQYMLWVIHLLSIFFVGQNLIYVRRLLFHPHLQRILNDNTSKNAL